MQAKLFNVSDADNSQRIDNFLFKKQLCNSRKIARTLIERGAVFLNRKMVTFPSKRVFSGDSIMVLPFIFPATSPDDKKIKILHSDDSIIVIDKPAGMLSVRTGKESGADALKGVIKDLSAGGTSVSSVYPVHRLDRETSGVMVFARTREAQKNLEMQFKKRMVKKHYFALMQGIIENEKGKIAGVMKTTGEYAESEFRVVDRLTNSTIVDVFPKTGRTNQIRIQFSEMGHPLVGEHRYFGNAKNIRVVWHRLALHSLRVTFFHPSASKEFSFSAPLPDGFKQLIDLLKKSDRPL
ncbi:MAG TPA: RluA family pseudouridine synthase [bacterium]